jgi:hypothetical protein
VSPVLLLKGSKIDVESNSSENEISLSAVSAFLHLGTF